MYKSERIMDSGGSIQGVHGTGSYGVSLIFTGPRADNTWFTDEDVQGEGANDIIYCGYPNSNRVSTDIGTGLNDPETKLYYLRNRTYGSIPGTVLRQEPKSRQATGVATRVLQRDPIGYAGGVNLYEYVGGRAVVAVDPSGLLRCVPCYQCQQTLDREEREAIRQISQEAIGLGFPGDLSWKITAGGALTIAAGSLWGGPIGAAVGLIFGLGDVIGKEIELGALMDQQEAEIRSDIAAYNHCMSNCSN